MATYARNPETAMPTASVGKPFKRSIQECHDMLTAPGQMHELTEATIFGRKQKVFKNCPPALRDFWIPTQQMFADREYLVLDDERLTYKETHRRAIILAEALKQEFGVKKGDKVAVLMRNRPDWVVVFWAVHLLGGVLVAVNAWLSPEAMVHCLKISDSVVAVLDEERGELFAKQKEGLKNTKIKQILVSSRKGGSAFTDLAKATEKYKSAKDVPEVDIKPEDDAVIYFTSGTTSFPKAVLSTQRAFLTNLFTASAGARRAYLRAGEEVPVPQPGDPQKALLIPVPLFHTTGSASLLMLTSAVGGKVVFMHKWSITEGFRLIKKEKITTTGGVPFIVQEILENVQNPDDIKTVETFMYGGAPANDTLTPLQAAKHPNGILSQAYGLSETNSVIVSHAGADYQTRPLSTGLASFVNDIRIVDGNGKDLPDGEIGEILVRGPNLFKEYYNDLKATKAAIDKDGWFKTGDLASRDHEGFIYIRDRAKDIIIRGGENIAATAVENALWRNPAVQDCAVVAVSDKKLGELPAAVVVLKASASKTKEQEIIDDSKKYLPKHAVPVMVMLRISGDASADNVRIERNANGKIVKNELKKVVEKEWQRRTKAKL